MLELRPIYKDEAFSFIKNHHRHHGVPAGGLWWQAVHNEDGVIEGVAISGRPVSRELDDGLSVEVTRLCTLGSPNACSMLYSASRRVAMDKGYRRGITYILASESGSSLIAAGWRKLWRVRGRSWDCKSRRRIDKHPLEDKIAYGWGAWPEQEEGD